MPTKKRPATKTGLPRKRKGVKLEPAQLAPGDLRIVDPPPELEALMREVEADGGAVLAAYREPLGGHALLLAALPIEKVERTAFQRDVSDAHVRKLTLAMDKTRRYLDPVIAVRGEGGRYLTPNGGHRLTALQELGARSVVALVVPERKVAYQILALNIEKAHNLREKALEVVRMYRELAATTDASEGELALELEEPALATLGFAYEERGRLSGGAYHPILKKVDAFLDAKLRDAMRVELRLLVKSLGITTIFVTHDQLEAMSMSDQIALMRAGKVVQLGAPRDVYLRPNSAFAADFMGRSNMIAGVLRSPSSATEAPAADVSVTVSFGELRCVRNAGIREGSPVLVVIRPQAIAASLARPTAARGDVFQARIDRLYFLGDFVEAEVSIGTAVLRVMLDAYVEASVGQTIWLEFPADRCVVVEPAA